MCAGRGGEENIIFHAFFSQCFAANVKGYVTNYIFAISYLSSSRTNLFLVPISLICQLSNLQKMEKHILRTKFTWHMRLCFISCNFGKFFGSWVHPYILSIHRKFSTFLAIILKNTFANSIKNITVFFRNFKLMAFAIVEKKCLEKILCHVVLEKQIDFFFQIL